MNILQNAARLLFPSKCVFCRRLIDAPKSGVCPACEKKLPLVRGGAAIQRFPFVSGCYAPLYYEKEVRDALLRYKFSKITAYAPVFAKYMSKSLDENAKNCDIISWVPLSRQRLRRRGYDQARLLCENVSKELGRDCVRVLEKTRDTPAQSGQGGIERRRENVKNVYKVCDAELVRGKKILLIDDIVTTGSTFSECARMLLQAGADSVYGAAVARKRD